MGRKAGRKTSPSNGAVTPDVCACTDEVNSRLTRIQPRLGWRSFWLWEPSEARWGMGCGNGPIRPSKDLRERQHRGRPNVFPLE